MMAQAAGGNDAGGAPLSLTMQQALAVMRAGGVRAGAESLIWLTGGRTHHSTALREAATSAQRDDMRGVGWDAVPLLSRALLLPGCSADDASVYCAALCSLAAHEAGSFGSHGVPRALVAAISTHAGSAAVCEWGCSALSSNAASSRECVAAGAPMAVVAALTAHGGNASVCAQGCWALLNFTRSGLGFGPCTDACIAAGAPRAVAAGLAAHAGSPDVCAAACAALSALSQNPAHRGALVACGAVAPLASALARHPSAREHAHSALAALGLTDAGEAREAGAGEGQAEALPEQEAQAQTAEAAPRGQATLQDVEARAQEAQAQAQPEAAQAAAQASRAGHDYDFLVKLLLIGDTGAFAFLLFLRHPRFQQLTSSPFPSLAGAGKSNLLIRYADNRFAPGWMRTIGVDFRVKTVEVDGLRLKVQVRAPHFLPRPTFTRADKPSRSPSLPRFGTLQAERGLEM